MTAVAQSLIQDDIHPLLRHPKPIKRDYAKAQQMLGLVADDEEKLKALQREKSFTTQWLERPIYEQLLVSDTESEGACLHHALKANSTHEENKEYGVDLSDQWTKTNRPTSFHSKAPMSIQPNDRLDKLFVKKRPGPIKCSRPVSYVAQHLPVPNWSMSPDTMSPNVQGPRRFTMQPNSSSVGDSSFSSNHSTESAPQLVHPATWTSPNVPRHTRTRTEQPVPFQYQGAVSPGSPTN